MKTPESIRRVTQTLKENHTLPPLVVAGLLVGLAAAPFYFRSSPSAEAVTERMEDTARAGRLLRIYPDGENSYLSFPTEGVVKISGAFDPALAEVGRLCGVPTSIAFWGTPNPDINQIGYVTVKDDKCLDPLKAELSQLAQSR